MILLASRLCLLHSNFILKLVTKCHTEMVYDVPSASVQSVRLWRLMGGEIITVLTSTCCISSDLIRNPQCVCVSVRETREQLCKKLGVNNIYSLVVFFDCVADPDCFSGHNVTWHFTRHHFSILGRFSLPGYPLFFSFIIPLFICRLCELSTLFTKYSLTKKWDFLLIEDQSSKVPSSKPAPSISRP